VTAVELARAAAALVPAPGATMAIAVYDGTHHRAAWLIDGRRKSEPVGPAFVKPRDAIAFVRTINGTSPSASRSSDPATPRAGEPDGRFPEAPDGDAVPRTRGTEPATTSDPAHEAAVGASLSSPDPAAGRYPAAGVRTCAFCGGPLQAGSRPQRKTCSGACRQALSERVAREVASARLTVSDEPVGRSERSEGSSPTPVPTSSEAPGARAFPGASRDAGPLVSPGPPGPVVPTLGL